MTIDDLYIGQQFVLKKHITTELLSSFSYLTGDYHPLHCDLEYSNKAGFEDIIAPGFLIISYISYIVGMHLPGQNALILSQEAKFSKPIFLHQDITYVCEIVKIDKRFSVFDLKYVVTSEASEIAVSGSVKIKVRNPVVIDKSV